MCAETVFSQNCWDVKNEVFEKKIASSGFVFSMVETEKQKKGTKKKNKMENGQKIYKNSVFKGGHPKMRMKKMVCKNCLTLFESGREKKRAFSYTQ